MNYTYDEEGVAFYYFIITALTVYLIPATLNRLFRRKKASAIKAPEIYNVPGIETKKKTQAGGKASGVFSLWNMMYIGALVLLGLTLTAVWNTKVNSKLYDPFEVLEISPSSTDEQVTKAFKKLSRRFHPDKAKENKEEAHEKFVEISKAYKALTDPVARKNWEEHGNPDGQRNYSLGIALPSWLVDKKYSMFVLAFYLLVFGLGVPYLVGRSWFSTKQYTKDKILHSTMALFFQQLKEGMSMKRVADLLVTSFEFKEEFPMRPSDTKAIDDLIESIAAQVQEAGAGERYEKPKGMPDWQLKAHVLLFAHFNRFAISNAQLKADQEGFVAKACHLTLGMLQIALARQWLQTASQCIALIQCLVQGVWEGQSSLLQLPYVDQQIAKHAKGKKTPIRTIRQLVEMPEEDRRSLLRTLSDEQYAALIAVAKTFPEVIIDSAKFVTLGHNQVIPGGLVTVKLKLRLVRAGDDLEPPAEDDGEEVDVENFEFDEDGNLIDSAPVRSIGKNDAEELNQPIFCPRFPNEKRPYWWVVLTNMPNTAIVTAPVKVTDLVDSKVVTLQFTAPSRPGQIAINVHIKSDCLVGLDFFKTYTINILPAREAPKERWDISGEDSDSGASSFGGDSCSDSDCGHSH